MIRPARIGLRVLGGLLALASGYGWWFHLMVGPSHGPGIELGLVAGALALLAFAIDLRLGFKNERSP
jgi:hypothetical protein